MHYYKFNISDWNLGTSHLSLIEEAIYFRLVNHYYDSESPIALETQSVFRRLRLASESDIAQQILDEFFTKTEKGYVHTRCEEMLKEYRKTLKKNRSNGGKGGRPKKGAPSKETQNKPTGFPDKTQEEPKHNPNQEPLTINQEPLLGDPPAANPKKKNFIPPTIDQVSEYCESRKNGINPVAFVGHYETVNWYRGKTKITDWKACVRTWEANNKNAPQQQSSEFYL